MWWRFVRFGFRLLYNEFAFTYDLVSKVVSLGDWRSWQRSAMKHLPGSGRMLEIAHGTGDLQLDLVHAGYDVVGLDLSPFMGRLASRKLRANGLPVSLVRGRAQSLPFPDAFTPAIVCTFPTPFILLPEVLDEIQRILEPGGVFVVVPGGQLTGGGVITRVIEWLYAVTGQREGNMDAFRIFFEQAGFEVSVSKEHCPRSFAWVVVARKPI